jgi:hypothetical protein
MKTFNIAIVGMTILFLASANRAAADPRPPELGISSIQVISMPRPVPQPQRPGAIRVSTADYLHIRLYCGGLYGGTYLAGRVVVVEMREAGKAFKVLHQRTLPAISSTQGYSFYVPVPNDRFTTTTTIRVRFTTPDAQPSNDTLSRTFYQLSLNFSRNSVLRQPYGQGLEAKVRKLP